MLVRVSALDRVIGALGLDGELVSDALIHRASMDTKVGDQHVEKLIEVLLNMNGDQSQAFQDRLLQLEQQRLVGLNDKNLHI